MNLIIIIMIIIGSTQCVKPASNTIIRNILTYSQSFLVIFGNKGVTLKCFQIMGYREQQEPF